ncbi:MAG: PLDc N-terminal domain-containing protein [Vulcanibacillus sp.]
MEINWTLLLPVIILQISLLTLAIISLSKQKNMDRTKKIIWLLIIIFINIIGPIMYFLIGRSDD